MLAENVVAPVSAAIDAGLFGIEELVAREGVGAERIAGALVLDTACG